MGLKNILSLGGLFSKKETTVREAAGKTIDNDEEGWRRLTGDARRDLSSITQTRMQELGVYMWRTNPLANRLIELPVAFLLAEGVTLQVKDEEAQKWLRKFWNDPINNMDIKLPKKVRELALYGEQCYPAFVNEMNGHVRLGYLDPGLIETVVTDPDNIEQPIGVVTKKDRKGIARRYRIIVNGPEDAFSKRTRDIRETFTDGDCFYFTVNDLSNATRGHSDLLPQIDWLDGYDHSLFGELERWDFLRAFVWDVTLKGATPEEVKQRAREIAPPRPGSVRVHNDSETWNAVVPELNGADNNETARLFRNHILGGRSIPEHWFGGGGDVNRATAGEMGEPTFKDLSMRQRYIKHMLEEIGTFVIRQKTLVLYGSEPDQSDEPEDYEVSAVFAEMIASDTSKYATALVSVVTAVAAAVDRHLLSQSSAVALIALVAGRMGLEVDPEAELEQALMDKGKQQEEDAFPGFEEDEAA